MLFLDIIITRPQGCMFSENKKHYGQYLDHLSLYLQCPTITKTTSSVFVITILFLNFIVRLL